MKKIIYLLLLTLVLASCTMPTASIEPSFEEIEEPESPKKEELKEELKEEPVIDYEDKSVPGINDTHEYKIVYYTEVLPLDVLEIVYDLLYGWCFDEDGSYRYSSTKYPTKDYGIYGICIRLEDDVKDFGEDLNQYKRLKPCYQTEEKLKDLNREIYRLRNMQAFISYEIYDNTSQYPISVRQYEKPVF